jgi:GH15 family glucan-1,4-alpha-glucosidase
MAAWRSIQASAAAGEVSLSKPIEDYGFIGNLLSCALVARDGSVDWMCLPRFDSEACFAALLGTEENGYWRIAAADAAHKVTRRYRPGTTILETTFETAEGAATLIDFMPLSLDEDHVDLFRIVHGDRGRVRMRMEFVLRFDYGHTVPWVSRRDFGLRAVAGEHAVELHTRVELNNRNYRTQAEFSVGEGGTVPFALCWHPSHRSRERNIDPSARLAETERWWTSWAERCELPDHTPPHRREAVTRSLVTLKALTYRPTGGIVAAPTTSLPEEIGGERNWDYRFCWIRDGTLTLYALLTSGYREEAKAWREWMLRAAAGHPSQLQIMYGLGGERRLTELELPWLPGYENSKPVRIGNSAYDQLQLDVYGELMDALHVGRKYQLEPSMDGWNLQKVLLKKLERKWSAPDKGIWEVRSGSKHFTHSKLMAWVAYDRAIKGVEDYGLSGPVEEWRTTREKIRAAILENGWSEKRKSFVQYFGGEALDASLLLIPCVGFLPPQDPRVAATVDAIAQNLMEDGFVLRYRLDETSDGLAGREGTFLVCSFWLADTYCMLGRIDEAEEMLEKLLALRNDLGLLAEEYDVQGQRQLGNFPQAFSHVGIVNTVKNLLSARGPAEQRAERAEPKPQRQRAGATPAKSGALL